MLGYCLHALAVSNGAPSAETGRSPARGRGARKTSIEEMTHLERISLVEDVEEGRTSKDDPRYVALVEEERRRKAQKLADVVTRIRRGQFGTNREIATYYRESSALVLLWRREAHWSRRMTEAEWKSRLAATQRKRKVRNHDRTA